jgi:hypothetical protein
MRANLAKIAKHWREVADSLLAENPDVAGALTKAANDIESALSENHLGAAFTAMLLAVSFLANECVSEKPKARDTVTYSLVPPQRHPLEVPWVPVIPSEHPERGGRGDTVVVITASQVGASSNVSANVYSLSWRGDLPRRKA